MGFAEFLTIVFIVLKLIGTFDLSWWVVLLPEIVALSFYIVIFIAGLCSTHRMNRSFERMVEKKRKRMNRF